MKKVFLNFLLIVVSASLNAQDVNLINQSIKFIGLILDISDSNPMEKPESDSINSIFQTALQEYQNKESDVTNTKKVLNIFKVLYNNSVSIYSDAEEERRMKLRRAECFASIALLTDIDKGLTFIHYAKFALAENLNTPNVEFIEEQYLGLLIMEVTFKYKDNQLNQNDLKAVREFVRLHQTSMNAETLNRATSLLKDFEQKN